MYAANHIIDRQLRYFVALAEDLSITLTAERLDLSQPALSQQLSRLEKHLGHKLFERTGRGLTLTPIGAQLAGAISVGFSTVDQAIASICVAAEINEYISVASVHSLASALIPPSAIATRNHYRYLRLAVDCLSGSKVIEKVLRNRVDIGLVHGTLVGDNDLEVIPLLNDPLVFVFSHTLTNASLIEEQGILPPDTPIISFASGFALRRLADRFLAKRSSDIVAEVNSLDAMLALCKAGMGVCLLPRTLLHSRSEAANLLIKSPDNARGLQTSAVMIYLKERPRRAAVNMFIESILHTSVNSAGS